LASFDRFSGEFRPVFVLALVFFDQFRLVSFRRVFEFFGVFQLDLLFSGKNLVVFGTFWLVKGFPALFSTGLVVSGVLWAGYWHCFDRCWLVLFLSAGFSCVSADTGQFQPVSLFFWLVQLGFQLV
jgi:hypothetical protein